jgi:hypothetical protein
MSNRLVISSLSSVLLFTLLVFAQQKTGTIKGKIIDADTKEPLIGVNILIEYTTLGVTTDVEGNFIIPEVPSGIYKLVISYVGYEKKTLGPFEIKSDNSLNVNASLETSWGKLSSEEAWEDINKGIIQIYLCGWPLYTKEHKDLADKYGFKIACTGCEPMNTKKYDSVMVDYLKNRNGENWYEEFLSEWNNLKY